MLPATETLDRLFQALSDPTRRAVLRRLGDGPASVTELASPFDMALPSFVRHLKVLEGSGLVRSEKEGRVRTYWVVPEGVTAAEDWLRSQRRIWEGRLNRLDRYAMELKAKELEAIELEASGLKANDPNEKEGQE
jgi:DNA-binding transcriptional ArsR family regulator